MYLNIFMTSLPHKCGEPDRLSFSFIRVSGYKMLFSNQEQEMFEQEIEPIVKSLGFELVQGLIIPGKNNVKIRVTLFEKNGVSIDDCARMSRALEQEYDFESVFGENFSLEVSSPGINRKLKSLREYKIFIGKPVKLYLKNNQYGSNFFKGIIKEVVKTEVLILSDDNKELSFDIKNISKGKINENIQFN